MRLAAINFRGTSGSGKTFIVKTIMSHGKWEKWTDNNGKILGYYCPEKRWAVVGKYETACGGTDTIKTQNEIRERISLLFNAGYNVIFEGLLVSHLAGAWAKFAEENKHRADFLFYFLTTPLEQCITNVAYRRNLAGKPPRENAPKNIASDYRGAELAKKNLLKAGCYVMEGDVPKILYNLQHWYGL